MQLKYRSSSRNNINAHCILPFKLSFKFNSNINIRHIESYSKINPKVLSMQKINIREKANRIPIRRNRVILYPSHYSAFPSPLRCFFPIPSRNKLNFLRRYEFHIKTSLEWSLIMPPFLILTFKKRENSWNNFLLEAAGGGGGGGRGEEEGKEGSAGADWLRR